MSQIGAITRVAILHDPSRRCRIPIWLDDYIAEANVKPIYQKEGTNMQAAIGSHSKKALWSGRVISGLAVLFLLFDSLTKIMLVAPVVKASAQLGYPVSLLPVVGAILLVCTVVYAYPRTAVIGALLLTGYLGGAVEANLRIGTPLFSNVLFPVYFAVLVWGGVFLRQRRARTLLALRTNG